MRKFYTVLVFCIGFLSFGQINAVDDIISMTSNQPYNVLINDTINSLPIVTGQVTVTVLSSNTSQIGINSNGNIGFSSLPIIPNVYIFTYQICDNLNPTNCDVAILTINYLSGNYIVANDNIMPTTIGLNGSSNIGDILSNDFFNGNVPTINDVVLTIISPAIPINASTLVPVINLTTGIVSVPAGTPAGNYSITYQICAIPNPTICDTATVTVNVINSGLSLTKDDTYADNNGDGIVTVGDTILYNFTITNNTDGDLTNVIVTDINATVLGSPITLVDGQSNTTNFTALHIITQADIDAGQVYNLATVTATPTSGPNITATSTDPTPCAFCNLDPLCPTCTITPLSQTPSIDVILDGTFVDGNGNNFVDVGETVTYFIVVTNTGNTSLTNVTITSQNSVVVGAPISFLAVGQSNSTNFTATHTVTQQDLSNEGVENLVTASGNPPFGETVTDTSNDPTPDFCSIFNSTCINCTVVCLPQNLSMTTIGNYVDFNNDGFTNVGDVISYQYILSNLNPTNSIENLTVVGTNTTISGNPILSLAPLTTDSSTITGTYVLTQNDINNGLVTNTATANGMYSGVAVESTFSTTTSLNISSGIKLNAFLDYNNNGVQNIGEPSTNNIGTFTYQINNGVTTNVSSSSGMVTLYESNPSNNYNLGFTLNSGNTSIYTVTPSTYSNITVAANSGITTYNFAITSNQIVNTSVSIIPIGGPRPGFTYYNGILLQNLGNQTNVSGTITFTVNNVVTIISYPTGAVPTATGFTLNYTNLLPYQSRYFYVYFLVPTIPTVSLGQLLTNSVSITIPTGDINPSNNTATLTQDIRSSYDPNDKQESHGGKILHSTFSANDYLNYTIQFENTGNAEAINIHVDDVLDAQLDENSIRMVDASHDYVLERVGTNLTWRFNGINLPPSNGSATIGHGYITFQIKPKPGYAIGDVIPNFANIYFDFNPAIVTDTCNTEFVATLANTNFAFKNFTYYPNPVKNSLSISNDSAIDKIEISSILGQQIITSQINNTTTDLDLSELSNGIYFVKVVSEGQEKVVKILKE